MSIKQDASKNLKTIKDYWVPFRHMDDHVAGAVHFAALMVVHEFDTWEDAWSWAREQAGLAEEAQKQL